MALARNSISGRVLKAAAAATHNEVSSYEDFDFNQSHHGQQQLELEKLQLELEQQILQLQNSSKSNISNTYSNINGDNNNNNNNNRNIDYNYNNNNNNSNKNNNIDINYNNNNNYNNIINNNTNNKYNNIIDNNYNDINNGDNNYSNFNNTNDIFDEINNTNNNCDSFININDNHNHNDFNSIINNSYFENNTTNNYIDNSFNNSYNDNNANSFDEHNTNNIFIENSINDSYSENNINKSFDELLSNNSYNENSISDSNESNTNSYDENNTSDNYIDNIINDSYTDNNINNYDKNDNIDNYVNNNIDNNDINNVIDDSYQENNATDNCITNNNYVGNNTNNNFVDNDINNIYIENNITNSYLQTNNNDNYVENNITNSYLQTNNNDNYVENNITNSYLQTNNDNNYVEGNTTNNYVDNITNSNYTHNVINDNYNENNTTNNYIENNINNNYIANNTNSNHIENNTNNKFLENNKNNDILSSKLSSVSAAPPHPVAYGITPLVYSAPSSSSNTFIDPAISIPDPNLVAESPAIKKLGKMIAAQKVLEKKSIDKTSDSSMYFGSQQDNNIRSNEINIFPAKNLRKRKHPDLNEPLSQTTDSNKFSSEEIDVSISLPSTPMPKKNKSNEMEMNNKVKAKLLCFGQKFATLRNLKPNLYNSSISVDDESPENVEIRPSSFGLNKEYQELYGPIINPILKYSKIPDSPVVAPDSSEPEDTQSSPNNKLVKKKIPKRKGRPKKSSPSSASKKCSKLGSSEKTSKKTSKKILKKTKKAKSPQSDKNSSTSPVEQIITRRNINSCADHILSDDYLSSEPEDFSNLTNVNHTPLQMSPNPALQLNNNISVRSNNNIASQSFSKRLTNEENLVNETILEEFPNISSYPMKNFDLRDFALFSDLFSFDSFKPSINTETNFSNQIVNGNSLNVLNVIENDFQNNGISNNVSEKTLINSAKNAEVRLSTQNTPFSKDFSKNSRPLSSSTILDQLLVGENNIDNPALSLMELNKIFGIPTSENDIDNNWELNNDDLFLNANDELEINKKQEITIQEHQNKKNEKKNDFRPLNFAEKQTKLINMDAKKTLNNSPLAENKNNALGNISIDENFFHDPIFKSNALLNDNGTNLNIPIFSEDDNVLQPVNNDIFFPDGMVHNSFIEESRGLSPEKVIEKNGVPLGDFRSSFEHVTREFEQFDAFGEFNSDILNPDALSACLPKPLLNFDFKDDVPDNFNYDEFDLINNLHSDQLLLSAQNHPPILGESIGNLSPISKNMSNENYIDDNNNSLTQEAPVNFEEDFMQAVYGKNEDNVFPGNLCSFTSGNGILGSQLFSGFGIDGSYRCENNNMES